MKLESIIQTLRTLTVADIHAQLTTDLETNPNRFRAVHEFITAASARKPRLKSTKQKP